MPTVKLDENVPDSVGTILREAGHDVAFARDEQLAGVPDVRLVSATAAEGRVLVTFDRGFANVIQHPPGGTPGIVVIRLGEQTLPRIPTSRDDLGWHADDRTDPWPAMGTQRITPAHLAQRPWLTAAAADERRRRPKLIRQIVSAARG